MQGASTHNGGILNFESNVCHNSLDIDPLLEKSELLAEDDLPTGIVSAKYFGFQASNQGLLT